MFKGEVGTTRGRLLAWNDSLFVDHAVFRLAWSNFAEVVPGKVYRCNHPTPGRLRALKHRFGIRTLINLRGQRQCGSDALSRSAAERLGLNHIDMAFESRGAPHKERILRFADLYQKLETPALMHCKSGADRAGLAAGLVVVFEGGTAAEAAKQLSWRFGHFARSKTGILDVFFHHWAQSGEGRMQFLDWVRSVYDENQLRQAFRSGQFADFVTDTLLRRE